MCDYSLQNVKTRPAKVGDKLVTRRFSSGTSGFAAPENVNVAVCVLPGTELSFACDVRRSRAWPWSRNIIPHNAAVFRNWPAIISGSLIWINKKRCSDALKEPHAASNLGA